MNRWILGAAGMGLMVPFGVALPAHAQALSRGNKIAAYDVPAVYQVFATTAATLTFPDFSVDARMNVFPNYSGVSAAVQKLVRKLQDSINRQGGNIDTAERDLAAAGANQADLAQAADVVQHPENYSKQKNFSESVIIQSGSAFAIDEGGYLVTNAHVAKVDSEDVRSRLSQDYESATSTMEKIYAALGIDPESDKGQTLAANIDDYLYTYSEVATSTIGFKILPPSVGRSADDASVMSDGWNADLIYAGEPYPGKDVALLKLSLGYPLPAAVLSSMDPSVGDPVYIIGFPGAANLTSEVENQATFTAGTVSAVRVSDSGDFAVFQTDGSAGSGSSGGPVLNAEGDVVGILTLGTDTKEGGNFNFFLPVSLIKEMVSKTNVSLSAQHPATDAYRHGIDLLQNGNCQSGKAALAGLQKSIDSVFVDQMIRLCIPGATQLQLNTWEIAAFFGGIVAIAFFLWWHRRRAGAADAVTT